MKRLRRWAFNGFAAMSLLLCVLSAILCSIGTIEMPRYVVGKPPQYTIAFLHHGFEFGRFEASQRNFGPSLSDQMGRFQTWDMQFLTRSHEVAGFRFSREPAMEPDFSHYRWVVIGTNLKLVIPLWFLVLIFIPAPIGWLIHWQRQPAEGFCIRCGYDLCATPDRCPECGTIPAKRGLLPC